MLSRKSVVNRGKSREVSLSNQVSLVAIVL